jgi:hypothetical protein
VRTLGSLKLHLVTDGEFRLDGGAMFGVVPKPLWEKVKPADERNRIRMATNCLLIESGSELVLIDSGIGDQHDAKFLDFTPASGARELPESLRRPFEPATDHVVLSTSTSTTADGIRGASRAGRWRPSRRRATGWSGESRTRKPTERDRASYFPRPAAIEAGVAELFDGGGNGGDPECAR